MLAPPSSAGLTHETTVLPSEPPPYYVGDTARGRRGLGGAGGGGGPGAVAGGVDGPHLHVIVDVVGQSAKGNLPEPGVEMLSRTVQLASDLSTASLRM